jgi:cytochrome c-type biogenesis protein CcmF
MMPYVTAILATALGFFLILVTFVASPFKMYAAGKAIADNIPDGRGLDPLLQYWTMAIHPPMLYLGYVGFTVPFAFAIASLITKQKGDAWIHTTRRWTLVTWLFQTTGVILGMGWAYSVLGWGGYWGWDPVENASLLPWITATAFLHSVMMQEKRGMMKVWNIVLISATFFLCIFGTFLTRSGIVQSVHAFSQGTIGKFFVTFLAIGIAAVVYLILDRLSYLKSEAHLESVVSRESSFLFNNLVLLASCFAVLWGTLFPVISEAISGEKISVDKPFFDRINVPIGLFLIFLTGVGPLIAWRRSSFESLRRAFQWPAIAAIVFMGVLAGFGVYQHPFAMVSFGLCLFVTVTVAMEFFKGSRAIGTKSGINLVRAAIELTHRNTRRYGGYIVHMGIVLMFVGFTGAAFNKDRTVEVAPGSPPGNSFDIGRYTVKVTDLQDGENDNYVWSKLTLDVFIGSRQIGTLTPERRFFKASRSQVSEVSIRRRLNEDLYLNYAGNSTDSKRAVVQAYVNPLTSWVWIGYWVVLFGTLTCLVPSKIRLAYARTQIVGITKKHVSVEK